MRPELYIVRAKDPAKLRLQPEVEHPSWAYRPRWPHWLAAFIAVVSILGVTCAVVYLIASILTAPR